MRYIFFNALCHLFHLLLIVFVALGWLFPAYRMAHLGLIVLTLACWILLARWYGFGYCPITDWHWKMKQACGKERPKGSYIHLITEQISGRIMNADVVDKWVLIGTIMVSALSLIINLCTLSGI